METTDSSLPVHRTAQAVAKRILALIAVVDKAHDPTSPQLESWVSQHGISDYFSSGESAFIGVCSPSQESKERFSWHAECLAPLFWALNQLQEMPPLNVQIEWHSIASLREILKDPNAFVAQAILRSASEIDAAEADLYHQHWRVRDAQLFGKPMPLELDPAIVYYRRYAASWLVGWGKNWDTVPTDT